MLLWRNVDRNEGRPQGCWTANLQRQNCNFAWSFHEHKSRVQSRHCIFGIAEKSEPTTCRHFSGGIGSRPSQAKFACVQATSISRLVTYLQTHVWSWYHTCLCDSVDATTRNFRRYENKRPSLLPHSTSEPWNHICRRCTDREPVSWEGHDWSAATGNRHRNCLYFSRPFRFRILTKIRWAHPLREAPKEIDRKTPEKR